MQSAGADHVVTTAAVVTVVLPVKGIVKDIAVGSSTGAVDSDDGLKEVLSASRFRPSMFKSEGTFEAHRTELVTMGNLNMVPRLRAAPA